jgi:hypothetical protein
MKKILTLFFLGLFMLAGSASVQARNGGNDDRDTTTRKEKRAKARKAKAGKDDKGDAKISISERGTPTDKPKKEKTAGDPQKPRNEEYGD